MNKRIRQFAKRFKWVAAVLLVVTMFFLPNACLSSCAETDPLIIVSMGDSYSSGDGLEPYYGQDKTIEKRIKDQDWLGHRSTISWPALIEVPGYPGTMADYKVKNGSTASCQWYFVAAGGATCANITSTHQKIGVNKAEYTDAGVTYAQYTRYLPPQSEVFEKIDGEVDYVTITIGGNDVGFGNLVKACAKHSPYLGNASMEEIIGRQLKNVDEFKIQLKDTYLAIIEAAGPQATILAVGYPALLDEDGKGSLYALEDAAYLNKCVHEYNAEMEKQISRLREEGLNIYFVNVEDAFEGHLAFSDDPWISGIIGPKPQELNDTAVISGSSLHPTAEGARAYAKCVNEAIKELEKSKSNGSISGKVASIYGGSLPVSFAEISVYNSENKLVVKSKTDASGDFNIDIAEGSYKLVMSAPGYVDFTTYVTVQKRQETLVEGILFYIGISEENGIINGKFKNPLTGVGVSRVDYYVRKGWNNSSVGPVVASGRSDSRGYFTLDLPLGYYSMTFGRSKYITENLNIVVEKGTKDKYYVYIRPLEGTNDFTDIIGQ